MHKLFDKKVTIAHLNVRASHLHPHREEYNVDISKNVNVPSICYNNKDFIKARAPTK